MIPLQLMTGKIMFVRHLESIPLPCKAGLVLALNTTHKKYFLISSSYIDTTIGKMQKCVERSDDSITRIFAKFREVAYRSELSEWEFYYSLDPKAIVPGDIAKHFVHVESGSACEASCSKAGRSVYKVTHNFTDLPIYVVDKSITTKSAIMKKVVAQLEKYLTQTGSVFAHHMRKDRHRVAKVHWTYDTTLRRTAHDPRDVTFELVADSDEFATHASQAQDLNLRALAEWMATQQMAEA